MSSTLTKRARPSLNLRTRKISHFVLVSALVVFGLIPGVTGSFAATTGAGDCVSTVSSTTGVSTVQPAADPATCITKFTSAGSIDWTPPVGVTSIRALLVGGGGGGDRGWCSYYWGRGGGGGGVIDTEISGLTPTPKAIIVGAGETDLSIATLEVESLLALPEGIQVLNLPS